MLLALKLIIYVCACACVRAFIEAQYRNAHNYLQYCVYLAINMSNIEMCIQANNNKCFQTFDFFFKFTTLNVCGMKCFHFYTRKNDNIARHKGNWLWMSHSHIYCVLCMLCLTCRFLFYYYYFCNAIRSMLETHESGK